MSFHFLLQVVSAWPVGSMGAPLCSQPPDPLGPANRVPPEASVAQGTLPAQSQMPHPPGVPEASKRSSRRL